MPINLRADLGQFLKTLGRKKPLDVTNSEETQFKRCLNTFELTLIGIGSTIGVGLYVISAEVARDEAGPGILLSFTIAAIVSLFSAICYAELACKIPRTGSAYTFAYVTCGEFVAFIVGWNMLMEMVIGAAGVGRAASQYVDSCFNYQLSRQLTNYIPWWPGHATSLLGNYPDFLAFICVISITGVLLMGVKASSRFNVVLTVLNLLVFFVFVFTGFFYLNLDNLSKPDGFLPHGVAGMLSGAASCFYAFVGFDCITTMCEETKTPKKSIPKAILFTLVICYSFYMISSFILVTVLPYNQIPSTATLAEIFKVRANLVGIKYVVDVGAVFALMASLVGSLLPIPRILYAISQDGLLPSVFSEMCDANDIPAISLSTCGLFGAFFALAIDLGGLVEMMSIGTLIAYTVVAISVILFRYNPEFEEVLAVMNSCSNTPTHASNQTTGSNGKVKSAKRISIKTDNNIIHEGSVRRDSEMKGSFDDTPCPRVTVESYSRVVLLLTVAVFLMMPIAFVLMQYFDDILAGSWLEIGFISVLAVLVAILVTLIGRQPQLQPSDNNSQSNNNSSFSIPAVPYLPIMAVFFNFCLIAKLHWLTWIRFTIWCIVGLCVYFGYSSKNSLLNQTKLTPYRLIAMQ